MEIQNFIVHIIVREQVYDKSYINNTSPPNPFM